VIPYDAEAARAREAGQILVQTTPDAPAARQYVGLVESLCLNGHGQPAVREGESPVLRAAAVFQGAPTSSDCLVGLQEPPPAAAGKNATPPPARNTFARPSRKTPTRLGPDDEPDLQTDSGILMSMPEIPVLRLPRLTAPKPDAPLAPSGNHRPPAAAPAARPAPPRRPAARKRKSRKSSLVLWVCLAMTLGFVLRFFYIPPRLAPLFIGVAVAGLVVMGLRLMAKPRAMVTRVVARIPASRLPPPGPIQPAARPEPKKEINNRLASLARRPREETR
jgi:hypothetical protein